MYKIIAVLCVASTSACGVFRESKETAAECTEFAKGNIAELEANVNPKVRIYAQAAADVRTLSNAIRASARTACANIALELGGTDTWSALGDVDESVANGNGTGACDAANSAVNLVMTAGAAANANFALVQVPGACYPDFAAQVECEGVCKAEATCDSGTTVTRCPPAELSVQCSTTCNAEAYCEGTPNKAANSMGKCQAECTGECKGTCTTAAGVKTDNDPNCHGKCSAACHGTCKGRCKNDTPIACGTSVSCKGGCSSTYTEPKCETTYTPPTCTVDADCLAGCSASIAANAPCDPPHTVLYANVTATADIPKLVATINANLGALQAAAEVLGPLAAHAAESLSTAGTNVVKATASLDAKSIACAAAAAAASTTNKTSISVSVQASVKVQATCASHSS